MKTYSPFFFFEALKLLFDSRPDVREHMQVNFMGTLGEGYDPIIEEMGLDSVVNRLGYLDYNEHLEVLCRSHVLLLVLSSGGRSRGWIPSKLFSYLGSGNPVLGLVPDGEVQDIITSARAGVTVAPDDVEAAAREMQHLYEDYYEKKRPFEREESEVVKFERRHLTSLLASALDRLEETVHNR
jgi:glycosyltransferase involved in cell wall biosynthesis